MKWKAFAPLLFTLAICGVLVPAFGGSPLTDGLILHVDAGSLEGFNDGDPVGVWPNLAPRGYDAVQSNSARHPLYMATQLNGRPVLRFDGADDWLLAYDQSGGLLTGDHPFEVFIVLSLDKYGGGSHTQPAFALGESMGGNRQISHLCFEQATQTFNRLVGGAPTFATAIPLNTYTVVSNAYAGGGTVNYEMWVNGVEAAKSNVTGDTHDFQNGTITIGRPGYSYSASGRFDGDVAEMLVFNRYLSLAEKHVVGGYLSWKYAIGSGYVPYRPRAELIYPLDGQADVNVNTTLQWRTGVDPDDPDSPNAAITRHFVYLSTAADPNLTLVGTVAASQPAEYAVSNLERDTVYHWRIEEGIGDYPPGDPNNIPGPVWSFTTVPATPIIDAAFPTDALVDAGADAVLTASAINPFTLDPSNLIYQWKDEAGASLVDSAKYEGATTSVLTIKNAAPEDEGLYYCTVTVVESGKTGDTAAARVTVKRLIGHWPFDGDLKDVVAGNDGIAADPNFGAGIVDAGQAVAFGAVSQAVEIPAAAHRNRAFTLTWWDNANPALIGGTWESMVASGPTTGFEVFEADRYQTTRYAFGFQVAGGSYGYTPAGEPISRGQWVFHALSYDPDTMTASWYLNGRRFYDFADVNFTAFDASIHVGNSRDGSQPYRGSIDDLQLYNYALEPEVIAGMYHQQTGSAVCVSNPVGDLDNDCRVTLSDVAVFVGTWMDCNLVPECVN